jgi:queuine tRNA-ribosyltransferase
MGWNGPILTDSGGYQVFSLAKLRKIKEEGCYFNNHVDGTPMFLGPETAMEIQAALGSDIAMLFDECTPWPCSHPDAEKSLDLTLRWARRCRDWIDQNQPLTAGKPQLHFGIVQGSTYEDLRQKSARELVAMDFPGYAIGGLSVGETKAQMAVALDAAVDCLPAGKIRYMMGVGMPEDLLAATAQGVDMFDCVVPTRHGRNHTAFGPDGSSLKLRNAQYADDPNPLVEGCGCYCCRNYSRAYLRHLAVADEMLAGILLSIHNIHFLQDVMRGIRARAEGNA